jgi:hypothetical protein
MSFQRRNRAPALPGLKFRPYIQAGYGKRQHGAGLGSLLGGLFKSLFRMGKGFARKALSSSVGKSALKAGKQAALDTVTNVALDAARGKNVKESLGQNLGKARTQVLDAVESTLDDNRRQARAQRVIESQKRRQSSVRGKKAKRKKPRPEDLLGKVSDVMSNSDSVMSEHRDLFG